MMSDPSVVIRRSLTATAVVVALVTAAVALTAQPEPDVPSAQLYRLADPCCPCAAEAAYAADLVAAYQGATPDNEPSLMRASLDADDALVECLARARLREAGR